MLSEAPLPSLSSSKLLDTIGEDIREHEVVILDFTDTVYVDDSAALVVEQLIETAKGYDTHCIVMGLGGASAHNIQALNVLKTRAIGTDRANLGRSTRSRYQPLVRLAGRPPRYSTGSPRNTLP